MEAIGILGFLIGALAMHYGMTASSNVTQLTSQLTQLRVEHEVLKKNLKDLGVLKEEQEPVDK